MPTTPTPSPRLKPRVDGWLVLALALLVSLAISWSALSAAMRGEADPLAAGTRYLVGLALAWAGIYGFAVLVASYASTVEEEPETPDVAAPAAPTLRRATDALDPSSADAFDDLALPDGFERSDDLTPADDVGLPPAAVEG